MKGIMLLIFFVKLGDIFGGQNIWYQGAVKLTNFQGTLSDLKWWLVPVLKAKGRPNMLLLSWLEPLCLRNVATDKVMVLRKNVLGVMLAWRIMTMWFGLAVVFRESGLKNQATRLLLDLVGETLQCLSTLLRFENMSWMSGTRMSPLTGLTTKDCAFLGGSPLRLECFGVVACRSLRSSEIGSSIWTSSLKAAFGTAGLPKRSMCALWGIKSTKCGANFRTWPGCRNRCYSNVPLLGLRHFFVESIRAVLLQVSPFSSTNIFRILGSRKKCRQSATSWWSNDFSWGNTCCVSLSLNSRMDLESVLLRPTDMKMQGT